MDKVLAKRLALIGLRTIRELSMELVQSYQRELPEDVYQGFEAVFDELHQVDLLVVQWNVRE